MCRFPHGIHVAVLTHARHIGVELIALKTRMMNARSPERVTRGFFCARYWDRTSDLFRVREARYRCANRALFICCTGTQGPCARYWDRTSDLFRVKEARYRCANRADSPTANCWTNPRWRRDSNPCIRLCRPLPRLSATPPSRQCHDAFERMTGFEPATLTLAR